MGRSTWQELPFAKDGDEDEGRESATVRATKRPSGTPAESRGVRTVVAPVPVIKGVHLVADEDEDEAIRIRKMYVDDGSELNLITKAMAREVEDAGVTVKWERLGSLRAVTNDTVKLLGLIPKLPVFIQGVRFEITAHVCPDGAAFSDLLWGRPAAVDARSQLMTRETGETVNRLTNAEGRVVEVQVISERAAKKREVVVESSDEGSSSGSDF